MFPSQFTNFPLLSDFVQLDSLIFLHRLTKKSHANNQNYIMITAQSSLFHNHITFTTTALSSLFVCITIVFTTPWFCSNQFYFLFTAYHWFCLLLLHILITFLHSFKGNGHSWIEVRHIRFQSPSYSLIIFWEQFCTSL